MELPRPAIDNVDPWTGCRGCTAESVRKGSARQIPRYVFTICELPRLKSLKVIYPLIKTEFILQQKLNEYSGVTY
jgi:hypothetical protein